MVQSWPLQRVASGGHCGWVAAVSRWSEFASSVEVFGTEPIIYLFLVSLSSASICQYFPLINFQIAVRVIAKVCCVAVIAGACDGRSSAVAVIAR